MFEIFKIWCQCLKVMLNFLIRLRSMLSLINSKGGQLRIEFVQDFVEEPNLGPTPI